MRNKIISIIILASITLAAAFTYFRDGLPFVNSASAAAGILEVEYLGNPISGPIFSITNMLPGDCVTRSVVVRNASSDSFDVSVKSENEIDADNLSSQIDFEITSPAPVYSNTLEHFYTQTAINLGTFAAGQETTFIFEACFKTTAGNVYQNTSTTFDLVFTSSLGHNTNLPAECSHLKESISKFFVGTPGDDNINGSSQNDFINLLGGNDKANSKSGHDCVVGGDGDDHIIAGSGADVVLGGNGNDKLHTDSGDDRVYGGDGDDYIDSGSGDDLVYAGAGNDIVKAQSSNDQVYGEGGNDDLDGGTGNDLLDGGADTDSLKGGPGNDTCVSGEAFHSCEL